MKKIFCLLAFLVVVQFSFAQLLHEKGIHIEHTSYNEAFAKARKENKFFFIDCYTTWCGPCKMMAANTFTDDSVGLFFNHFFVSYKQDMEHNEGPQLAPIFHIEAYPTFLFIKPNGDIFYRAMGYMPPKNFLEATISALGADANLDSLTAKSNRTKLTTFEYQSMVLLAAWKKKDYEKSLTNYFQSQPESNWTTFENFDMIRNYATDILSPEVQYLIKNKAAYENAFGKPQVNDVIKHIAELNIKSSEKKKQKAAQKVLEELSRN